MATYNADTNSTSVEGKSLDINGVDKTKTGTK